MNTSKTLDLKPFRMNTYRKTGEGGALAGPPRKTNRPLRISASGDIEAKSLRNHYVAAPFRGRGFPRHWVNVTKPKGLSWPRLPVLLSWFFPSFLFSSARSRRSRGWPPLRHRRHGCLLG